MNWENKNFTRLADGVELSDIERARVLVTQIPDSEDKTRLMKLVEDADKIYSENYFKVEEHRSGLESHIDSYSKSLKRFVSIVEEYRLKT